MWSSSARTAGFVVGFAALAALSACTGFTPLYGSGGPAPALNFPEPGNRAEQLIYQDLALRFSAGTTNAPTLDVSAKLSSGDLTSDSIKHAFSQKQATVTAKYQLTSASGDVLLSGQRSASADYETGAQVLANQQALDDAAERAAHLLADTIRLSVLGALKK
jgi:hypothetical protein